MEIKSRNTNTLAPAAYALLQTHGVLDQSRNGPVLRLKEPLTIHLTHPWERVNFCPVRDANPFFHLIESCAMLANENNIPFLAHFAKQMAQYSDDGKTQNAFYGTRLRSHFRIDQLDAVIENLTQHPHSRREVALIWEPADLLKDTKDKACNLLLMFAIDETNRVTMTSVNRSNDAIWGMVSGANVVHLSLIHEYVACSLGRMMSDWWHFSNNFHIYTDNPKWERIKDLYDNNCYPMPDPTWVTLFSEPDDKVLFDKSMRRCVATMVQCVKESSFISAPDDSDFAFLEDVAHMFNAYQYHKLRRNSAKALQSLNCVRAPDWKSAGISWINRRYLGGVK